MTKAETVFNRIIEAIMPILLQMNIPTDQIKRIGQVILLQLIDVQELELFNFVDKKTLTIEEQRRLLAGTPNMQGLSPEKFQETLLNYIFLAGRTSMASEVMSAYAALSYHGITKDRAGTLESGINMLVQRLKK